MFDKAEHLPKLEIRECDVAERFVKVKKVLNFDNKFDESRIQESEVVKPKYYLQNRVPGENFGCE